MEVCSQGFREFWVVKLLKSSMIAQNCYTTVCSQEFQTIWVVKLLKMAGFAQVSGKEKSGENDDFAHSQKKKHREKAIVYSRAILEFDYESLYL